MKPHLVKYQWFVVVRCVVLDDIKDGRVLEEIDHLDPVEVDHHAATSSAGNVLHFIGLQGRLDISD